MEEKAKCPVCGTTRKVTEGLPGAMFGYQDNKVATLYECSRCGAFATTAKVKTTIH